MIDNFIETVTKRKKILTGLLAIIIFIPIYIHLSLDEPYIDEAHRYLQSNSEIEKQFGKVTGIWTNTGSARWSSNKDSLTMWFSIDTDRINQKGILVKLRNDSTWIAYDHFISEDR